MEKEGGWGRKEGGDEMEEQNKEEEKDEEEEEEEEEDKKITNQVRDLYTLPPSPSYVRVTCHALALVLTCNEWAMLCNRNLLLSNAVGISILESPNQNPTNSGLDSIMSATTGLFAAAAVVDVSSS